MKFPKSENDIPKEFRFEKKLHQTEYLIDGETLYWSGKFQEVISPITAPNGNQIVIGSYPMLTEKEALLALDAAVKAYGNGMGEWPTLPVEERIKHVENFVQEMKTKRDEVVNLIMWEIGKRLSDARKEFDRTIEYIEQTIEALKKMHRDSSQFVMEQGIMAQIRRAPRGVVLCMGPYNYPLNETYSVLIPALLMGNTMVFKTPKYGVLLHQPFLQIFKHCFPAGVVNTIYGDGATVVTPIMQSGKIDILAFIGSSKVADIIKKQHPQPHKLKSILGLGAKNPAIILEDADLDLTVKECVTGSLSFNGQRCTALKILFVDEEIVKPFIEKFSQAVSKLSCGMPWEDSFLTPLPEKGKAEYLKGLVEDAVSKGAKVVNMGGGEIHNTFFHPAILYPVTPEMRIYSEEQFGPIVPIVPFSSKICDAPLQFIKTSDYGQQASIFGNFAARIASLIDLIANQVCRININSQCQRGPDSFPFTGRKDSAEGTLSITDALKCFSIRTLVSAAQTEGNKKIIRSILRTNDSAFLSSDFIF